MSFIIDFNWASQAIIEQQLIFEQGHPNLRTGGLGPVQVTLLGNGRWHHTSSYYYNCGANIDQNTPPPEGDLGQLSKRDMNDLKNWFVNRYPNQKPNVLPEKGKKNELNFTLVFNTAAFNFHVEVE